MNISEEAISNKFEKTYFKRFIVFFLALQYDLLLCRFIIIIFTVTFVTFTTTPSNPNINFSIIGCIIFIYDLVITTIFSNLFLIFYNIYFTTIIKKIFNYLYDELD